MNDVGVTRQYKDLVARFDAIPFARSQTFDLDGYVVDKGLGGLFHVLDPGEGHPHQPDRPGHRPAQGSLQALT